LPHAAGAWPSVRRIIRRHRRLTAQRLPCSAARSGRDARGRWTGWNAQPSPDGRL